MKKQLFIATAIITLLTGGIFAAEQNIPPEIKAMLLDKASRHGNNCTVALLLKPMTVH